MFYIFSLDLVTDKLKEKINKALRIRYEQSQALLLYPWQKEMTNRLREGYTPLQIQCNISARNLKEYPDLFTYFERRVLILGKHGIGKTTLCNKIALDWAEQKFNKYDSVLVLKLRNMKQDQFICDAIAAQYKEFHLSADAIHAYLSQSSDSVLLILDGLDEIDLDKYPQVKNILSGHDYPSTCVMVTSRPHVSPDIKEKMSCIATITGFSPESAQQYISLLIPEPEVRQQFFKLLRDRKMNGMYEVPILLQALASLYEIKDGHLPQTHTATFQDLIQKMYLDKVKKENPEMTEEEIGKATDDTNELAFFCLMKGKLTFPTRKLTNTDILKLGILSVARTESQYDQNSLAEFAHETLQEFGAASHVAKEYIKGNNEPWQRVKTAFAELFQPTTDKARTRKRAAHDFRFADAADHIHVVSATVKFIEAIMREPEASLRKMAKVILIKDVYGEDTDRQTLRQALRGLSETDSFTEDEFNAFFDYAMHFLSLADKEQREKLKERASNLLDNKSDGTKLAMILSLMTACMEKDEEGAIEVLWTTVQSLFMPTTTMFPQEAKRWNQWLQDQANSRKTLFRFILGNLRKREHRTEAEEVLKDVAELLLDHAFDRQSSEVLSFHFISQYIQDIMSEAGFSGQYSNNTLFLSHTMHHCGHVLSPVVVHIKSAPPESLPDITKARALKLEKITSNLDPLTKQIQKMTDLTLVELQNMLGAEELKKLAKALSESGSIVSLVLDTVKDAWLCSALLQNLPSSTMRLTMHNTSFATQYRLPKTVYLECLHIAGEVSDGITELFNNSHFPNLKRLTIMNPRERRWSDTASLLSAVRENRMPALQHLCIRFANLSRCGSDIREIATKCRLHSLDLMDTSLSFYDGQHMLDIVHLPSIVSLNLLHNRGLNAWVRSLNQTGNKQQIDIKCAETMAENTSFWSLLFHFGYNGVTKAMCNIL